MASDLQRRIDSIDAIVIGTSAGGVEALAAVLPALARDVRVAVFVVQHLPRDRRSLLVNIFSARCAIRIEEAQDKQPAMPGCVYIAPPDYHLLIDAGPQLALSVDELVNYSRPSIDVLFESAADVYRERLMGVLLTGANRDGAAGLAAVQQAGGLTVVQDPATAIAPYMPAAALARMTPDHILSLEQIAQLFRQLPSDTDRP